MNLLPSIYEPNCQKCSLAKVRTNIVPSYLPDTTEILFLAEAPGVEEDREGERPLVGAAGKALSQIIRAVGFTVADERLGYAYIVKCRPIETNEKKISAGKLTRPVKDGEIKACADFLEAEIKSLPNLKVIICLGAIAVKRVFGKTGMRLQELRGKVIDHDVYGKIIVTHHPSRILHAVDSGERANLQADLRADLIRAKNFIDGGNQTKTTKPVDHKIVRNITQARWVLSQLKIQKMFTFDTETSNFDAFDSVLLCFSFSWKMFTGVCLPLVGYKCEEIWTPEEKEEIMLGLKEVFLLPSSKKVAQNGKFDLQHLRYNGIEVVNFYSDTMLMAYLLNESGSHGLKELAWMYTDAGGYDDALDAEKERVAKELGCKKAEVSFQYFNPELLWKYACYDADVTFRLMYALWPKLEEENLIEVLREVFIPISLMLTDVEYGGVSVDRTYLDSMIIEYKTRIENLTTEILQDRDVVSYIELMRERYIQKRKDKYIQSVYIQRRYSEQEYCEMGIDKIQFNAKSPKQLRELFIDMLGMPVIQKTDKGNPQLNAVVLEIYADRIPIARTLSYQNKLKQLLSTFLVGIRGKLRADGKLHSSFLQHIAATARLSSRSPNLQNVPNKDKNPKESKEIRNLFVGDTEEDVIIEGDLGQAEFRVWGLLAKDEVMYEDLRQGVDIHRKFASIGYEMPEDEVTDVERSPTKGVVFGTIYGRSPKSVAVQLNMPEAKAKKVQQALFNRYRRSAKWLDDTVKFAHKHGYVLGFFGNRRHLEDTINHPDASTRAHAERQAKNSPIQGSASLMNCLAGVRILEEFKKHNIQGRILSFIHDAILVHVHKSQAYQAYKIMQECMTHPHPAVDVPLTADFKVGFRWGEAVKTKTEEDFIKVLKSLNEEAVYSVFTRGTLAWLEKEPLEFEFVVDAFFSQRGEHLPERDAFKLLKQLEVDEGFTIDVPGFSSMKFYSVISHAGSNIIWLQEEPLDYTALDDGNTDIWGFQLQQKDALKLLSEVSEERKYEIVHMK